MQVSTVSANGLEFAVATAGEGPAVILLHGFPDSHQVWRHQIPALADAGYRVIAPDLRGFGASAKPPEVSAYAMQNLVGDVLGILAALGEERAAVVGHDWGAVLAWVTAAVAPQAVTRLVSTTLGHPAGPAGVAGPPPARAVLVHLDVPPPERRGLADRGRLGADAGVARTRGRRGRGTDCRVEELRLTDDRLETGTAPTSVRRSSSTASPQDRSPR